MAEALTLHLVPQPVRLVVEDAELRDDLARRFAALGVRAFSGFGSADADGAGSAPGGLVTAPVEWRIDGDAEAGYTLRFSDGTVRSARERQRAVFALVTHLNTHQTATACAAGSAVVHAGVVSFGGVTVAAVGTSGAGKTTLVQALLAAGAEYLSDEFALLWPGQRALSGYPKPLTVKRDGIVSVETVSYEPVSPASSWGWLPEPAVMAHLGLDGEGGEAAAGGAPAGDVAAGDVATGSVAAADTGDDGGVRRVHPADALVALMEHSPCRVESREQFHMLADIANRVPQVALRRTDPAVMAERVVGLLSGRAAVATYRGTR